MYGGIIAASATAPGSNGKVTSMATVAVMAKVTSMAMVAVTSNGKGDSQGNSIVMEMMGNSSGNK